MAVHFTIDRVTALRNIAFATKLFSLSAYHVEYNGAENRKMLVIEKRLSRKHTHDGSLKMQKGTDET